MNPALQDQSDFNNSKIIGFASPMILPRVLHTEHMQEEIKIGSEFIGVGKGDLPEQLIEDGVRKLWVFPATELQQSSCVLCCVRLLYQFLQVAVPGQS